MMKGVMTNDSGAEVIRELPSELPPGWRWRPRVVEHGEARLLLQRYTERGLPESASEDTLESARRILAQCISPARQDDASETGLVLGYVQSGKTLSFTTLAALARDNSFPLIIVLSGTKKNLYSQTVKRIRRDLDLERPDGRWTIFEAKTQNPDLPQQLKNLLVQWDQCELPGYPRKAALITVLKNRQRVDGLVSALRHLDLRGRSCLIVDDEADQYGLNTQVKQGGMSPVYQALLNLRAVLPRHTYVQYTATPQALLLISVLDSLSPKFGWVLAAGDGYSGGETFFRKDDGVLVRIIPDLDLRAINDESDGGPPESLLEALRVFYVGVAIQAVHRGLCEPTQRYRSMLVHPSMLKIDHLRFKRWVEGASQSWIELLKSPDESPDCNDLIAEFRSAYDELVGTANTHLQRSAGHETVPGFDDVLGYLPMAMLNTLTWEVNSRVLEQWTQDKWSLSNSHILVGGENLGRGFTVEGLTVTYMPRGRGSGVADTIQQRGRFFGYKRGYLGLCRVFLASDVRQDYENYIDHESYLMKALRELSESGKGMSKWRRRMLLAQSLHPTRRNVIPDRYQRFRASEWTQQLSPWIPGADTQVIENWGG